MCNLLFFLFVLVFPFYYIFKTRSCSCVFRSVFYSFFMSCLILFFFLYVHSTYFVIELCADSGSGSEFDNMSTTQLINYISDDINKFSAAWNRPMERERLFWYINRYSSFLYMLLDRYHNIEEFNETESSKDLIFLCLPKLLLVIKVISEALK